MFPEVELFSKWLHCRSPQATTHVHYTSDVKLFFTWAGKPSAAITLCDMDACIAHCGDSVMLASPLLLAVADCQYSTTALATSPNV